MKCKECVHYKLCRDVFCQVDTLNDDNKKCDYFEQKQPRGEWIEVPKYKGYYVCSECLKRLDGDFERFEHWEMRKDNFCPVCGSDNRKKEGDEK